MDNRPISLGADLAAALEQAAGLDAELGLMIGAYDIPLPDAEDYTAARRVLADLRRVGASPRQYAEWIAGILHGWAR
jgi:hypothetical protein